MSNNNCSVTVSEIIAILKENDPTKPVLRGKDPFDCTIRDIQVRGDGSEKKLILCCEYSRVNEVEDKCPISSLLLKRLELLETPEMPVFYSRFDDCFVIPVTKVDVKSTYIWFY